MSPCILCKAGWVLGSHISLATLVTAETQTTEVPARERTSQDLRPVLLLRGHVLSAKDQWKPKVKVPEQAFPKFQEKGELSLTHRRGVSPLGCCTSSWGSSKLSGGGDACDHLGRSSIEITNAREAGKSIFGSGNSIGKGTES